MKRSAILPLTMLAIAGAFVLASSASAQSYSYRNDFTTFILNGDERTRVGAQGTWWADNAKAHPEGESGVIVGGQGWEWAALHIYAYTGSPGQRCRAEIDAQNLASIPYVPVSFAEGIYFSAVNEDGQIQTETGPHKLAPGESQKLSFEFTATGHYTHLYIGQWGTAYPCVSAMVVDNLAVFCGDGV